MKIAIVGDIMLDEWIVGSTTRISPEAPVPVLLEQERRHNLGGAANLAANLANLGNRVELHGAVGLDKPGDIVMSLLNKSRITPVMQRYSVKTTVKTRLVDNHGHHMLRLDNEEYITNNRLPIPRSDITIVSDYNKGMITRNFFEQLPGKIFVDPKQGPEVYYGAFLVKPNLKEFKDWFGEFTPENARIAMAEYDWQWLVVTASEQGIYVFDRNENSWHFKEPVRQLADVSGAGDTVLAVLVHCYVQGMSIPDAAERACYAGARVVERRGVTLVQPKDLAPKVVFTNGCFDILHPGHVEYLKQSRALGDKLIVGLNSDASVSRLKGPERPINNQEYRKQMLEALECVDEVIIFEEDTPLELIKTVKPTVITKGGDYTPDTVVGADHAQVVILPTLEGHSTTNIINRLQNS